MILDIDDTTYVAVFDISQSGNAFQRAKELVNEWVVGKYPDLAEYLTKDGFTRNSQREFARFASTSSDGDATRIKLVEMNSSSGIWHSEVTLNRSEHTGNWLSIMVKSQAGIRPKPPKLVTSLANEGLLLDGEVALSASPRKYNYIDVESLAQEIENPSRRTVYLVAAADPTANFAEFTRNVETWTKDTKGLAHVALLDPTTANRFQEHIGAARAVDFGTIRTYIPGISDNESFAQRNKTAGRDYLRNPQGRVRGHFEFVARQNSLISKVPDKVRTTDRRLQRQEDAYIIGALAPESPTVKAPLPSPAEFKKIVDKTISAKYAGRKERDYTPQGELQALRRYEELTLLVKTVLGIDEVSEQSLRIVAARTAQSEQAQQALESLTSQIETLRNDLDRQRDKLAAIEQESENNELEQAISDEKFRELAKELSRSAKRNEQLEAELLKHNAYVVETQEIEAPNPKNWSEMLTYLEHSHDLIFMGDREDLLEIAEFDDLDQSLNLCWDAVSVLELYSVAKSKGTFTGSVDAFVKDPPAGFDDVRFPPGKHSKGETGFTKEHFVREFPVPESVSESLSVSMVSHFKLGGRYPHSPRLYYYDDLTNSKKIVIGYIGLHLTNRLT